MPADRPYLAENAAARGRLRALTEGLSDADLDRDLGDEWTVSMALAHLAYWDRRVESILARWQREGAASPSPTDDDVVNESLTPLWRAVPPRAAVLLALEAADAADRAIESLPPALADAAVAPESPLNARRWQHRTEHIEQIERALGR
jgi:hypothetical protein